MASFSPVVRNSYCQWMTPLGPTRTGWLIAKDHPVTGFPLIWNFANASVRTPSPNAPRLRQLSRPLTDPSGGQRRWTVPGIYVLGTVCSGHGWRMSWDGNLSLYRLNGSVAKLARSSGYTSLPPPPQHDKAVTAWGRRLVWRLSIPAPVERNDILYAWKCLTNRMRTSKYYSDLPEVPRKGAATPSRLNGWSVIMGDEYWLKEFWYHRLDMTSYYQKTVRVMNAIIRTKFCLNVVKILIFTVYDINTH